MFTGVLHCLHLDRCKNLLCSRFSDLIEGKKNALGTSRFRGFRGNVDSEESTLVSGDLKS